jgi:hypothetical protein
MNVDGEGNPRKMYKAVKLDGTGRAYGLLARAHQFYEPHVTYTGATFAMCAHPLQPFVSGFGYDLGCVLMEVFPGLDVATKDGCTWTTNTMTVHRVLTFASTWALIRQPTVLIDPSGTWTRYRDAVPHSDDDTPAVITSTGRQEWWWQGQRHRCAPDLPAVRDVYQGLKEWWRHGKRHRDNGAPAVVQGTLTVEDAACLLRTDDLGTDVHGVLEWYTDGVFIKRVQRLEST